MTPCNDSHENNSSEPSGRTLRHAFRKNASCILRRPPADQGGIEPATRRFRDANHETTPADQFEQQKSQRVARAPQKSQKTSSFCTSATPIPAEGCAGTAEIAKKPCTSTTPDPRRGSRGHVGNHKNPLVFVPRPRRSPQRVARACWKSEKTMGFCTSTTPIPAEGRASMLEIAKTMGFCTSTTPIPAEGRFSCSVVGTTPPP